jgi:putative peptidoglycan lipid II flippase
MVPTLFGSSVAQINLLFDVLIASMLVEASISWLYYGDRLMEFPLGLFGVALAVVILPTLSSQHARASTAEFRATVDWAVRLGWLIAVPAAVGLAVLGQPIAATLFGYGEFEQADVVMTAWALVAYCLGLPAFVGVKILAPAFYARQDTRTPVRVAIVALVANMVLNVAFVLLLAAALGDGRFDGGVLATLAREPGAHAGLALASSAAAWLNAGLLWRHLGREGLTPRPGARTVWLAPAGAVAMAAGLFALTPAAARWLDAAIHQRVAWLAGLIAAGAAIYAVALLAGGLRPALLARPDPGR